MRKSISSNHWNTNCPKSGGISSLVWCEIVDPSLLNGRAKVMRAIYTTDKNHELVREHSSLKDGKEFAEDEQFARDMISGSASLLQQKGSRLDITIHKKPVPYGDSTKGEGGVARNFISDGITWQPADINSSSQALLSEGQI